MVNKSPTRLSRSGRLSYVERASTSIKALSFILTVLLFQPFLAKSFDLTGGHLLKEIHTREEFKGSNQSWAFDFDHLGRVYVANSDELLIFDGIRWQKLMPPKMGIIRSVVVSKSGKVYLGGQNSLGYYFPNIKGNWEFKSLNQNLPIGISEIGIIRRGFKFQEKVYFKSEDYLIEIDIKDQLSMSKSSGGKLLGEKNGFWKVNKDEGLVRVNENGEAQQVIDYIPRIQGVYFSENKHLVITRFGDIFQVEDQKKVTINNTLVKGSLVVNVSQIPGGLALSTWNQGLIVINTQGETIRHIKYRGTSAISTEYSNGSLWVGFYGAIVRIPWPLSLQQYNYEMGLKGSVTKLINYHEDTYAGTSIGLHKFDPKTGLFELKSLGGSSAYVWAIEVTDAGMLIATHDGLYLLSDNKETLLFKGSTKSIVRLKSLPSHFLITSLNRGSILLKTFDGRAEIVKEYPDFKVDKQTQEYSSDGAVLLGTRNDGIYKITFNDKLEIETSHLNSEIIAQGRTKVNTLAYLFKLNDDILVSAFGRICKPAFEPTSSCIDSQYFDKNIKNIKHIKTRSDGSLIVSTGVGSFLAIKGETDSQYKKVNSFLDNMPNQHTRFFSKHSNNNWIGRNDGLWKVDLSAIQPTEKTQVWIRQVLVDEAIIYDSARILSVLPDAITPNPKSIRISFAATHLIKTLSAQWRSKLIGYEQEFDDWSNEAWRDFNDLPPGNYQILVELKNFAGLVSESKPLDFIILAPWYWSVWTKIIYLLLLVGLFVVTAKKYSLRKNALLLKRQIELKKKIEERTHELQLEKQKLVDQTVKLTELDKAKSRFFANITHEFRTPLSLMIGPLSDLANGRQGKLSNPQVTLIKLALKRSVSLMGLIEELLDISRLDAGVLVLNAQKVNMVGIVKNALAQLDSWAESKNIKVIKSIDCKSFELVVDKHQIERVITNLIGNAIKFTPDNGQIQVQLKQKESGIVIEIIDSGPGIDAEEVNRIFERFHQVAKTQIANPGGVGLGLSLAKEITLMHQGELTVTSALGDGASFSLYLPKETGLEANHYSSSRETLNENDLAMPDIEQKVIEKNDQNTVKATVLVVEDDLDLRRYIVDHLSEQYRVIESSNGQHGIQTAIKELPDLIISDVMMPVMDGIKMCQKLKSNPETDFIPLILLTAKAEVYDRVQGFEQGADEYIAKPFSSELLKVRIANLINSHRKLIKRAADMKVLFPQIEGLVNQQTRFVQRFQQAIKDNLSDTNLSVEEIANKLNMDRSTLYKKVQSNFNSSPSELIRIARLNWAKELVVAREGTIADIAFTVGYSTVAHFSSSFKKEFGCTPSHLRKQHQSR